MLLLLIRSLDTLKINLYMKQFLGILVMLLLSGCAGISSDTQKAYVESNYIRVGMDFSDFRKLFGLTLGWKQLNIHNTYPKYMHSSNSAYISEYSHDMSYGFESNSPAGDGLLGYLKGYKLTKIFNSNLEAVEYYLSLNPTNQKQKYDLVRWRTKQKRISGGGSKTDKQIAKARSICEKIGVTPGTDKFIDCTIKMMSTSTAQQTVIVGSSQRRSIYPLHCRQMGGASNC